MTLAGKYFFILVSVILKQFPSYGFKQYTCALFLNCSVHLVELRGTGEYFAMKAMDKSVMLNRNKVGVTNFITHEFCYYYL